MISEQEAVENQTAAGTRRHPAEKQQSEQYPVAQEGAKAAQSPPEVTNPDLESLLAALEHERISGLAYFYWEQRGCPVGSPDEDWFRAQRDIREGT